MHKDPTFKGRSLAFSSDLSIAAPIKRGLVPALDAVSYKTRAQRLLDTLHAGRMRNHEYAYARLFSDAVERVQVIQSVRVAVREPEDKLLLTVSFDGNWDAYIRTLWVKVGGLLDVIFCNTEGYVEARLHSCEAWGQWVREHQVQTHFFYGSADGSATDLLYLRRQERLRQDRRAADPEPPPGMLPRAEQRAREMLDMTDPTIAENQWPRNELMVATFLRQGLQSLAGLHRLADWYVPGTPDGDVLHRAAHELLQDFVQAWDRNLFRLAILEEKTLLRERFDRQIRWLFDRRPPPRVPAGGGETLDSVDQADVQGGIVEGYSGVTHGALLFFSFDDASGASRFLTLVRPLLHAASHGGQVPPDGVRRTLFLSLAGLRRLGLDDTSVDALPEAFVQGMAARAGLLGDRHDNHPERWTPPLQYGQGGGRGRIDLAAVHAVVYLRVNGPDASMKVWDLADGNPLRPEIARLQQLEPSARLIAVEPLRRLYADRVPKRGRHPRQTVREHFGFVDGNGQPGVGSGPEDYPGNHQPYGEFLVGHPGRGDVKAFPGVPPRPDGPSLPWLRNSSFLVVRKYRQWPDRFNKMLDHAAQLTGLGPKLVAARLMGRSRSGHPLVRPGSNNNQFTYLADPTGRHCPLHAHVRRANPRKLSYELAPGEREPRILRRSMSYGPSFEETKSPEAERGLMFMAFNADIAEQFEVVQRWLAGGHATDTSSGISCPIVGVPEPGRPRRFEFELNGTLARIPLDGEGTLLGQAQPLVRLEWGAYWLAPSLSAIDHLAALAPRDAQSPPMPFSADHGRTLLQHLAEQGPGAVRGWKEALEDAESQRRFDAASLWAAVRRDAGGVLKCPMGVLVGSRDKVAELLRDPAQRTTVSGYAERMPASTGLIFLGLDDRPDSRYRREAVPVRAAIGQLDTGVAFETAREAVRLRLEKLILGAIHQAGLSADREYELVFDDRELVDEVLARLCERWFGLRSGGDPGFFERGGFLWKAKSGLPRYPGHFMAPSRYLFQPVPERTAQALGEQHGTELREAMKAFLQAQGPRPLADPQTGDEAPVGRAIVEHPLSQGDPDFAARTMVGAIMGFVPTMDGALRAVIAEWRRSGELARLRGIGRGQTWQRADADRELADAMDRALQLRPVPDVIWRRAAVDFELAPGVDVKAGQTLVLGLGSAAHESLEQGRPDDSLAMFGGARDGHGVPTHACPGYAAARAAMLGALTALVTSPLPLQELPGSASWRVCGEASAAPAPETPGPLPKPRRRGTAPLKGRILCWGDSWLDYREGTIGHRIDLLEALQRNHAHYTMLGRGGFASYAQWGEIATMARLLLRFQQDLKARLDLDEAPDAILLSGGGNDSTGPVLARLLNRRQQGRPYLLPVADDHIATLRGHYRTVLAGIAETCRQAGRPPLPVLLHGYDHPFPGHHISPWLKPAFESVGYDFENPADVAAAAEAMKELIQRLNADQADLIKREFRDFARHVDLQGVIARHWTRDPREGWDNELHPTERGFELLARHLDDAIQAELKMKKKARSVRAVRPRPEVV